MGIRDIGSNTIDTLAALGRSVLEKTFTILGKLDSLATSYEVTSLRADLTQAITGNKPDLSPVLDAIASAEVDLSPVLSQLDGFPGEGRRCMRHSIRPGWAEVAVENASPITAGAFLPFTNANTGTTTSASFVVVTEGTGAGAWRYTSGTVLSGGFQRFDLATGLPIGPRYNPPIGCYAPYLAFVVAVGKYIYLGATASSSTQTSGSAGLYRFNTETGLGEALASFPKKLMFGEAVVISAGRLLVTASIVADITQTPAACSFFIVDTATGLPPVEVVVDVKLTKYPGGNGEGMRVLPSGAVLLTDKALNANSAKQSVVLTVSPSNVLTVGPVEETGSTGVGQHNLLGAATGAHLFNLGTGAVQRTYVEGQGWGPAALSLAYPNATAVSSPNGVARTINLPGGGWLLTGQTSNGSCGHALLCPGLQTRGDVLVDIYKL